MKRSDYFSDADPLCDAADTIQAQLAEIEHPRRHDQVLSGQRQHQLNAKLVGAVFAKVDNQRRSAGTGPAACVDRNIQPVDPGRLASQLPRVRRAGAELHGSRVRSKPESDGQMLTGFG